MINKVTLIGNAGAEPELKHLENGTAVASLSLATNENWQDKNGEWQKQTEWHRLICWRETAERLATVKKGQLLYVEGKISYRKYQDKDGNDRYTTDIVCSTFRILEKKEGANDRNFPTDEPGRYATNENPTGGNAQPTTAGMGPETLAANLPDMSHVDGDTLPF
jgi:single-strand DNA-binding protein